MSLSSYLILCDVLIKYSKEFTMSVPVSTLDTTPAVALAPGPHGQFLLGSIRDFQSDPLNFIQQVASEYGPVARFRLANVVFNLVSHPDGIQQVLQSNNHNYIKGEFFDPVRQMAGDGLFASEGAHWLRQRRLMQPAFHRQRIAGFADIMVRQTEGMLERWETLADTGEPVDVSQAFTELTMRIIAETMFSVQLAEDVHRISEALTLLLADLDYRFQVPFYPRIGFPTLRNLRAQKALHTVDEVLYPIIQERRNHEGQQVDLLQMLMGARDEETGEGMSDQDLRDELITMFVAGHETTAVLLTWLFHILSSEPEWEVRLVDEVSTVLSGRQPGFEDLPSFPMLRMAIDETLRLYPPLWLTNRNAVQDDEICGYRIRAGEVVGIAPYVTHRLPAYWPDPERFDPLRFEPERSAGRPRFAYLPFGGGPRQCIGNNFALQEAQLIFATLVPRFRLQAIPERPVKVNPSATLRPKDGLWMRVERRRG
jgi:cytochrome P450